MNPPLATARANQVVPAACRGIQDQIDSADQVRAKFLALLAKAPPERRAALQARIDEVNDRITALRRDLQGCIDMNGPSVPPPPPPPPPPLPEVRLPKRAVDREVYVSIAGAADAATDVVAGILDRLVAARPNVPAGQLTRAAQTIVALIDANVPDPAKDRSPNEGFRMAQILAAVVPRLDDPPLRRAATEYTKALLGGFRAGSAPRRQVQPLDLQFDRLAGVQQLRHDVWRRLYDAAAARPAIATAINSGPLGGALGVATTDSAAEAVAKVQMPTLRDLVNRHIRPDGSLVMPSGAVERTLGELAAQVGGLRDSYTVNLIEINVAITAAEKQKKDEPKTALQAAIATAEAKQKELDKVLKGAAKGIKSTFGVLATLADVADLEFGGDLREFAEISVGILNGVSSAAQGGIDVAKALAGLASASADQLFLGGGAGFALVMVTLMIQTSGLFGSRSKPINQVILEEVRKLAELVSDLRDEMRERFDQLDRRLDRIYAGILTRLAQIDFNIGQVDGNVQELQDSLYELHTELTRLTADLQALLDAAHRRDLVEAVNGFLNFAERTGETLDADGFQEAENVFYSWGNDHAKDPLQAGPEERAFTDDDLQGELIGLGPATNINYLRMVPAERFGLAPLGPGRLANPLDWIAAAEAYSQLSEENPTLAAPISDARVEDLIEVGEVLGGSLARIANPELFAALAAHYRTILDDVTAAIDEFEHELRVEDADSGLLGIDLWGGAEQEPSAHFFTTSFDDLGRCGGGKFDAGTNVVPASVLDDFDRVALVPYLIADNLSRSKLPGVAAGLGRLAACVSATWRQVDFEEPGLGGLVFITYALTITVNVSYDDDVVYRYRADTDERFRVGVPKAEAGSFEPATDPRGKSPYPLLVGDTRLWSKMSSHDRSQGFVKSGLRPAMVTTVEDKLRLAQRAFYRGVADRLVQAGDPIGRFGQRLTGSKLLWQAMVMAGLPLSVQANDILRSLLFGGVALLGGTDADGDDTLLDDLQDLYALFAARDDDPPPVNILDDIRALANERLDRLVALLDGILDGGAPPEPPQVFAPTVLRLGLLVS